MASGIFLGGFHKGWMDAEKQALDEQRLAAEKALREKALAETKSYHNRSLGVQAQGLSLRERQFQFQKDQATTQEKNKRIADLFNFLHSREVADSFANTYGNKDAQDKLFTEYSKLISDAEASGLGSQPYLHQTLAAVRYTPPKFVQPTPQTVPGKAAADVKNKFIPPEVGAALTQKATAMPAGGGVHFQSFVMPDGRRVSARTDDQRSIDAILKEGGVAVSLSGSLTPKQPTRQQLLLQSGLSKARGALTEEQLAAGIAANRFVVSVNPQDNSRVVIDLAAPPGQDNIVGVIDNNGAAVPIGATAEPGAAAKAPIDASAAVGIAGALQNTINTISDFIGKGAAYPDALKAETELNKLNVITTTTLQAAVPGRPSNFLLKKLETLEVPPNAATIGTARSLNRLKSIRDMISTELMRMKRDVLTKKGSFKPNVYQEARGNYSQLSELLKAYDKLIENYNRAEKKRPPLDDLWPTGTKK